MIAKRPGKAAACLPLVLTDPAQPCAPRLHSEYDEAAFCNALHEITLEGGFVFLTMTNAVAVSDVIPPAWRHSGQPPQPPRRRDRTNLIAP
ncbi:hypothetical protein ACIRSS_38275 [Amycolatopsis sp. NPDC101161]|uniref:hypothetical protein n=1 Tax=Amycolatopsis sp. NPDC101161 TaxID=3363940 RepID=UPI00380B4F0F